jgi:hypothetical protein
MKKVIMERNGQRADADLHRLRDGLLQTKALA